MTSLLVLHQQRMNKPYPRDILPQCQWRMLFCFVSYFPIVSVLAYCLWLLSQQAGATLTSFQWQEGGGFDPHAISYCTVLFSYT